MHHSTRNDQFAFHTCLMAPETDQSSFTMGCAHYGQLILLVLRLFVILVISRFGFSSGLDLGSDCSSS